MARAKRGGKQQYKQLAGLSEAFGEEHHRSPLEKTFLLRLAHNHPGNETTKHPFECHRVTRSSHIL